MKIGKKFCNSFSLIGLQPCAENEASPKVIFLERRLEVSSQKSLFAID